MASYERFRTLAFNGWLLFSCVSTTFTMLLCFICGFSIDTSLWSGWHLSIILCLVAFISLWYFHFEQIDSTMAMAFLGGKKSLLMAHRGGALEAPENTIAAINMAAKNGADGVEIDIEFTRDDVAVLLHDDDVDRTTNGTGLISQMDRNQAQLLNAAATHPLRSKFPHEPIPTLHEAVELCLKLGHVIFFDCKRDSRKTADCIQELYQLYPKLYTQGVVCSFYPNIIYAVRKKDPNIVTALTFRQQLLATKTPRGPPRHRVWWKQKLAPIGDALLEWCQYTWLWYLCGNSLFLAHTDIVTQSFVEFWHKLGIQVAVWTPNKASDKRYFRSLGCIIISDDVKDD